MAGMFENHDHARFETTALSFGPPSESRERTRLLAAFDRFLDVRMQSDQSVVELMRTLEIDIAIDLKGFTQDARTGILARRPAPVQVSYLGYPGTMGARYIDYLIADRFVIPDQQRPAYSEKVVWLPECYQVNDAKRPITAFTSSRGSTGLPEGAFVFCCFNASYKITPELFDVWMRLLRDIPTSVLWLIAGRSHAPDNLRCEAQARGVAPDRLVFAPVTSSQEHLARHQLADLFLDTHPYNAHTTASDALWAGLPVLTYAGETFAGRVAGSLLQAVGLSELVTLSLEDYEALARELASNPARLAVLRQKLAQGITTASLFDTVRTTRHIEAAFATMWERHCRDEPPQAFAVTPLP
jgi:protein O-GlcNAc transferase